MTTTRATITIEIEVGVSGSWAKAEPDVGLNEGVFEDAQIDVVDPIKTSFALAAILKQINSPSADDTYADAIQDALAEAAQADRDDDGDARYEAMKDRLID